jgi:hypothetical protein
VVQKLTVRIRNTDQMEWPETRTTLVLCTDRSFEKSEWLQGDAGLEQGLPQAGRHEENHRHAR